MRKFCSIVGVLVRVVPCFRDQFSVCYAIAPQFVRDDLSGYAARLKKTLEETFGCLGISSFLQIDIDDFAILIDRPPKVMLFGPNLYEHFV